MLRLLRPADFAVVSLAVLFVAAVAVVSWAPRSAAQVAELRGPSGIQRIALDNDGVYPISGRLGESVVEVKDGNARFVDSPCRNRVCIAAGWLARSEDFAACAPNGVSMRLRGQGQRYDAIAH
ncbi:MAG: NusG domain II-containing protein [Xanthomonadaceae bacterium]|nr:NusG domain II-containing protein [Xanthomonadaceae bacterium]